MNGKAKQVSGRHEAFGLRDNGTAVRFWIQPRASKSEIVGLRGDQIKVRIAAPPVDGEANEALLRFLSKQLKTSRKNLKIIQGLSSRGKTVLIEGLSPEEVGQLLGV